jgi:hypothetical protein
MTILALFSWKYVLFEGIKYNRNIKMLSALSTSGFIMRYYRAVAAAAANYTPFTYTTEGDQSKYVLPNDPDVYPFEITGGVCQANITDFSNTSFIDKNITLYFKTATTTGSGID